MGEYALVAVGLLLIADMAFLPWHRINVNVPGVPGIKLTRTALESPNAVLGVLALVLAAAMITDTLFARRGDARSLLLSMPRERRQAVGGVAVISVLLLKLFLNTDFLGVGSWVGILLAGVLALGGLRMSKHEGTDAPPPSR